MKTTPVETHRAASYTRLAEIYDEVMEHVNYGLWADFAQEAAARYRITGTDTLEVACGTGTLARNLAGKGYRMTCLDLNHAMLKVARAKLPRRVPLVQASMDRLPFRDACYDIILCLYDSINYLLEPGQVSAFLSDAAGLLAPDGMLLFDVCTEHNSRTYFANTKDSDTGKNFYYERVSKYRARTRIQENDFTLYYRDGARLVKYREEHRQRIYPLEQIEELIRETGRYRYEMFDGFSFNAPDKYTDRVHFALRLK